MAGSAHRDRNILCIPSDIIYSPHPPYTTTVIDIVGRLLRGSIGIKRKQGGSVETKEKDGAVEEAVDAYI
jgi:hypothetical protein